MDQTLYNVLFETAIKWWFKCSLPSIKEQSLRMLQTAAEEFKIFLWKITYPNIKCYFGFIPQQKQWEKY